MKSYNKIFFIFCMTFLFTPIASAFWWMPPTVCKMDTTKCYKVMGMGFDEEMWDSTSKCRGMKYVCPDALVTGGDEPELIGKRDLTNPKLVKHDYDTSLFDTSLECFGMRKLSNDGTQVYYNGKYFNIWCDGILSNVDEVLENGEVSFTFQPTCESLAKDNYAAIKNGNCYGKYYDSQKYALECGTGLIPTRIISINNADYGSYPDHLPVTQNEADKIFEMMYENSLTQKGK